MFPLDRYLLGQAVGPSMYRMELFFRQSIDQVLIQ
jgi:hypothetical protein